MKKGLKFRITAGLVLVLLIGCMMCACTEAEEKENPDVNGGGEAAEERAEAPQAALENAIEEGESRGLLVLINKENAVDASYVPEDLKTVSYYAKDRSAAGRSMRQEACDAFNALSEGAAAEGYTIVVTTAYRSYDFQASLYNSYVKAHGQAEADTFSAQPGKSEHQSGLSADVSSPSVNYQLTRDYIDTEEGRWLNDNAWKYGFIIRFPEGKEDITGYIYEPWHIRYVGKDIAKFIYDHQLTLEEFIRDYVKGQQ